MIKYFMLIFVIILITNSKNYSETIDKINKIAIFNIGYYVDFQLPYRLEYLFDNNLRYISRDTIVCDSTLRILSQELKKLKIAINISACDDYRLAVLVYRNSGKIDTIGFGECFVMNYNSQFYKPKIEIIELLISNIDKIYKDGYMIYINELKKYFSND